MQEESRIKELIWTIPRKGMSKDCQMMISFALDQYFEGKSPEELSLTKKNRTFVEEIYERIGQIDLLEEVRRISLEVILDGSSVHLMGHPNDYKDNPTVFADKFLRFCMREDNLRKKLLKISSWLKITEDFLIESYLKENPPKEYRKKLKEIGEKKRFYGFVKKVILNKNN